MTEILRYLLFWKNNVYSVNKLDDHFANVEASNVQVGVHLIKCYLHGGISRARGGSPDDLPFL